MAAPTVGAVMADILPYLGVERKFSEETAEGKMLVMENVTGLTKKDADVLLKQMGLTVRYLGTEETVTGQIPAAGQTLPGGSQVLLYLGGQTEEMPVTVPDFLGMNRQQAADTAGSLGLYILATGNQEISPKVTVTAQNIDPKTKVPVGTTIRLTFADTKAPV